MERQQRIVRLDIDFPPPLVESQEEARGKKLDELFRLEQNWLPLDVWVRRQNIDRDLILLIETRLPDFAWQRRVLAKKAEIVGIGSVALWPEPLLQELMESLTVCPQS